MLEYAQAEYKRGGAHGRRTCGEGTAGPVSPRRGDAGGSARGGAASVERVSEVPGERPESRPLVRGVRGAGAWALGRGLSGGSGVCPCPGTGAGGGKASRLGSVGGLGAS